MEDGKEQIMFKVNEIKNHCKKQYNKSHNCRGCKFFSEEEERCIFFGIPREWIIKEDNK